jgi:hypothetical protein
VFAEQCPGFRDDVVLLNSTPVECARSVETVRRSRLAECAAYGWSRSHFRFFWGMRLHLACGMNGPPRRAELKKRRREGTRRRPRAASLLPARRGERRVRQGYAWRSFEKALADIGGHIARLRRHNEPEGSPHLGRIRRRIASVLQTFKDLLSLERHGAGAPEGLGARIGVRLLALAGCIWLNHQLGRPTRRLVANAG